MSTLVATPILGARAALDAGEGRVGGKAMGLAKLARVGATVPWWVVVPVEAFEDHLARAGVDTLVADSLDAVGQSLRGAVVETPIETDLAAGVERAIAGRGPLAVRSSVVGEDSATHSFAGLFDSYLFLDDTEQVLDAIRSCWASAFNARALAYQLEKDGSVAAPSMGVILQEAVEGEVSGVLFTRNPVSGRADETLVSACWGLGEGIVGGAANTDDFVWSHDGHELSAKVVDKDLQVVRAPNGTREAPVPDERRTVRALKPHTVGRLCREGVAVAEALGAPQDIEWTLRDGELFLLQARPITAKAPLGARRIVWDNSNIQESFNGVTTPLTFSIAVLSYASVYEQTFRLLGVDERTLARYRPVFRNMLGLVSGRVYYNINNWYRCLLLLPSFSTQKEDMEHMMGLEEPVDFVEDRSLSRGQKLRRLPGLARVGLRLARESRRLDASAERFLATFAERTGAIDRDALAHADLDVLLGTAERLEVEVIDDWTTPIVNDIYVSTMSGKLRRLCERSVGEDAAEVAIGLLSGEEAIESMEPTRELMRLAQTIRADPALTGALAHAEPAGALAALRERSPAVTDALDAYLDRYGDRCMGEMKLETLSLRQDPSFIVQVLRNFVARPDLDPESLDARERARRGELERRATASLGRWRRRRLRKALARARQGVKARENMRFSRTRLVGLLRDVYMAAGQRLHEAGLLEEPRDVLYLTAEELRAHHEGTAASADLAGLVRVRRAEFAAYELDELPNHFETIGSPYDGRRIVPARAGEIPAGRVLEGTGCCPGVVEAELAVVASPDDDLAINGRILTAVRTDPGWTPLFPSAEGILIERGSTLSHSAVLAREFGIPAVVGIPGLMKTVRDGERVRLDGGSGIVERLDEPA